MRHFVVAVLALLLVAPAAHAVITFTQLDDDVFVVSHRVKGLGLRGKAMKMVYAKTASLCIAAGFSHMKVLHQESETGQSDDSANATIRAQYFFEDGEERVECRRNSEPQYVQQASAKLAKQGYRAPEPPSESSPTEAGDEKKTALTDSSCTLEQVAAMARAGLSDDKIRAACG